MQHSKIKLSRKSIISCCRCIIASHLRTQIRPVPKSLRKQSCTLASFSHNLIKNLSPLRSASRMTSTTSSTTSGWRTSRSGSSLDSRTPWAAAPGRLQRADSLSTANIRNSTIDTSRSEATARANCLAPRRASESHSPIRAAVFRTAKEAQRAWQPITAG